MKEILITGGDGDIASALARKLSNSFKVYLPNRKELDVSDVASVDNYFGKRKFDIVINAAGTLYSSLLIDSDPHLWIRDVNVNLIGTYLVTRKAILNNEHSRIINISSTAAYESYKDWTSYCAAKSGVLKLSGGLVKNGFDVIVLCPGAIDTKLREGLKINNPNVMDLDEGIAPIVDVVNGVYSSGDIIFYRKNNLIVRSDF
ncbi:SDR family oxidoreductase [Aeromonas caviae]|uniref:SDR family oxidoreductase n=1 Tax=Aeromonas caviae TaxID=648 RepID=UPI00403F5808